LHQLAALAAAAAAAAAAGAGAGAAAGAAAAGAAVAAADNAEENAAQRAALLEQLLAAAMAVAACSEGALDCPAQHFATPFRQLRLHVLKPSFGWTKAALHSHICKVAQLQCAQDTADECTRARVWIFS
jgi:hypothetical protein